MFPVKQYSNRRIRRLVLAALFLAGYLMLAESWMSGWMTARVARSDFRFLVRSFAGLPELVAHASVARGPNVLFLGDSVLQGGAAGLGPVTIADGYAAARQERAGRVPRIVNAANAGASLDVNRRVVDRLLTPETETVFLVINYRAFKREGLPAVYAPWLGVEVADHGGTFGRVGGTLDRVLSDHSSLYRNREWLAGRVLGSPLDNALSRFYFVATLVGWRDAWLREFHIGPDRTWSDSAWNDFAQADLLRSFDIPELGPEDENLRLLSGLAAAVTRQAEFIAVMPPINLEMVARYQLIDWRVFDHNLKLVRQLVEAAGGRFVDAKDWQPADVFSDSVHMIGAGNLSFGRQLADWHAGGRATP